jgi:hypothetical protein
MPNKISETSSMPLPHSLKAAERSLVCMRGKCSYLKPLKKLCEKACTKKRFFRKLKGSSEKSGL